jgi:caffeoyl-CoA O-methyltransferase
MEIINEDAERYSKNHSSLLDEVLQEIEAYTLQHHPQSQMLSGHVQGKLLEMISKMIRPCRILEIGTFTGFSALCLVKGLQSGGLLHTIDIREEDAATAKKYFEKAGAADKIIVHVGDAHEIIKSLTEVWDLVFIDADKTGYIEYYELTLQQLKKGGFILADNVLFHGAVLDSEIRGKNAIAIDGFNKRVASDERTEQVMLTVRDGLMLIRKL